MKRTILAGLVVLGTACGGSGGVEMTGAGATFPFPLYNKWFSDYARQTGVRINYQSIGSGGGIRQLQEGTVDFGATDAPMTDAEMASARGGPIMHFPTIVGMVTVAYNLPEVSERLRLTGETLGDIFLGRITRWNDPRIAALNPNVMLPARDILVVHRTDGSGTTYVFTDYLAAVSPAWRQGPGRGKEVQWPVGLGGKGNEGVAGSIKQTPGAVGYIEQAYATQNQLPTALIRNSAGNFVGPSPAAATAAAAGFAQDLPADSDYRVSIVNAPGSDAYPITSFTWIILYQQQADSLKGARLTEFLRWAFTSGQQDAAALDYAPLPSNIVGRLSARLDSVRLGTEQ